MSASNKLDEIMRRKLSTITHRMAAELGQAHVVNLHQRAQKGVGVLDQKMPAYNKGYQRRKAKSGRSTQVRNLTLSGRMLGGLVVSVARRGPIGARATIAFTDTHSRDKARWNQRISPWFGVSPRDRATLRQLAVNILQQLLAQGD